MNPSLDVKDFFLFCKMKIYLFLLLSFLLLSACNDSAKPVELKPETATIQVDSIAVETPKKEDLPRLTQENHERILKKYWQENPERIIRITTNLGHFDIRLFEETPIHSASFLMLVKRGYFNETLITRVVPQFVVQGGTTDLEETEMKRLAIGNYQLKPEFNSSLIHKKGCLSAARNYIDNPNKLSAPYNFFIVVGRPFKHTELVMIARNHNMVIQEWAQDVYQDIGGAPHLDGEHTLFGEVIAGIEVVEKMNKVAIDEREWPLEEIVVNMEVLR
jgi:peptidyl-prolyl cis-trans isomerase A (cyclophilin A)